MPRVVSYGTLDAEQSDVVIISSNHGRYQPDHETGENFPQQRRRRATSAGGCFCASYCCVSCLILMIVILAFFLLVGWQILAIGCFAQLHPPPRHAKEYRDLKNQSFTVGFDLTAGYGTASVSFYNGTVVDVARVEASPRYNEVMKRLSKSTSVHPTPPYYNCAHSFNDIPRQWVRYLRKRAGHPASPDVAALTDVLGKLKDQVASFLIPYGTLEMAFVTVPHVPAIYTEDLLDAAEHANFQLLTLPNYRTGDQAQWPVNELNSALAGNGIELRSSSGAQDFLDHQGKRVFDQDVETEVESNYNTFLVLFTQTALAAFVGPFWSSTHYFSSDGIANFSLGLSQCSAQPHIQADECPPEAPYWLGVRDNLRAALASYYRSSELARVVSWGESAHNEIFTDILKSEVLAAQKSVDPGDAPLFFSEFPVFSPARGAAEFGKVCSRSHISFACIPEIVPRMQGW